MSGAEPHVPRTTEEETIEEALVAVLKKQAACKDVAFKLNNLLHHIAAQRGTANTQDALGLAKWLYENLPDGSGS